MKLFLILLLGFVFYSCDAEVKETDVKQDTDIKQPSKKPFFELIVSENGVSNFGYQILQDGKMIINQQTIPSLPGTNGFTTKDKAQTAGEYILSKIENGVFPPTVSPKELDSLGVLN